MGFLKEGLREKQILRILKEDWFWVMWFRRCWVMCEVLLSKLIKELGFLMHCSCYKYNGNQMLDNCSCVGWFFKEKK